MVIFKTSLPFNLIRTAMFTICIAGVVFGVCFSKKVIYDIMHIDNLFGMADMSFEFLIGFVVFAAVAVGIFALVSRITNKIEVPDNNEFKLPKLHISTLINKLKK